MVTIARLRAAELPASAELPAPAPRRASERCIRLLPPEVLRQVSAVGAQMRHCRRMSQLPQSTPHPAQIPEPADRPYCGRLRLQVDATDVTRRIYQVRETIPVPGPGPLILLYPKWLPGFHSPQAPIELFAGLVITAAGEDIAWTRHPVTINAFHLDVPEGVQEIEARFQFLSPTAPDQGRVIASTNLVTLQWNTVLLYPAGYFARQIEIEAELTLPEGFQSASALEQVGQQGSTVRFAATRLDVLVDSPVFAGRYAKRIALDDRVHLNLFADQPEWLEAKPEQIEAHADVVRQCDRLFRSRHFDRFEMLLALSAELTGTGVEHHRSFEAVSIPDYFTGWDKTLARRDTVPHEYVHSWNGKHRRGADSWSPSFEEPIGNDLMWVYEGQTQYWCRVLCARAGLWKLEQGHEALAITAAMYEMRPGSRWRPMFDTTRDPIIAARAPLPWISWQRSEDYYSEGALMWLDVDTRIRELTDDSRSLDDFARSFFGNNDGDWSTDPYVFDDVIEALAAIAPFDWRSFFADQVEGKHEGAPLAGIERGGYRLVFREEPTSFFSSLEQTGGTINHSFSLGLTLKSSGTITDVLWEGPAFQAGLTVGPSVLAVNGRAFSADSLKQAIRDAGEATPIELVVKNGSEVRTVLLHYHGGLRYPHLERLEGRRARLDEILAPL
jgi:predicted metalloprotease with PDZ domain